MHQIYKSFSIFFTARIDQSLTLTAIDFKLSFYFILQISEHHKNCSKATTNQKAKYTALSDGQSHVVVSDQQPDKEGVPVVSAIKDEVVQEERQEGNWNGNDFAFLTAKCNDLRKVEARHTLDSENIYLDSCATFH